MFLIQAANWGSAHLERRSKVALEEAEWISLEIGCSQMVKVGDLYLININSILDNLVIQAA